MGFWIFYVDYGFASSIYDDWFWKIFYEKGSRANSIIWISDFDVYEEQRHMGIAHKYCGKSGISPWNGYVADNSNIHAFIDWKK